MWYIYLSKGSEYSNTDYSCFKGLYETYFSTLTFNANDRNIKDKILTITCVCSHVRVCVCTAEGDLLVIGYLSLDAPPLGSQPLRRSDAAPPAGKVLPLDFILILHFQLRYPETHRLTLQIHVVYKVYLC